ncbi:DUF2339 domain-containing protein [Luteolibacter pohnpeiensis]|uniref:DUF2339 domain-containing protein n=1 Tax=Luteolibacter pohnpeiensis TaxID=454153 RepID=A0A934SCF7_9BACT|nr:DUF2339 domain-containing protein [Luteolibacter pohnpeiensis]MBK1883344.1 DUF2339 domain-containing protein [Luteolibacter pohnpeiensis]
MPEDASSPIQQEILKLRHELEVMKIRHERELDEFNTRLSKLDVLENFENPPVADIPAAEPVPEPAPMLVPMAEISPKQAPQPSTPPPLPKKPAGESFELQFGRTWLVRIGIVLLLTGLVLLGNFAYRNWIHDLPNGLRLTGLFLLAGLLTETGRRLAKREHLHAYGEVVMAGGLAFFYYCCFAAHHVERLRVIDSPVFAGILLLVSAGAMAGISWIRNAKATAVLGLLLASYATILQPIGWLSCVSNVILALTGLMFMLRPGWAGPGIASMVGTYVSFTVWQVLQGAHGQPTDQASMWFLVPTWVIFSLPGVLGRFRETLSDRGRAWFTGANNAAFFLLFSAVWIAENDRSAYWLVPAVFGAVLLILGSWCRRQQQIVGSVDISQGLALITLALAMKLDGNQLPLALAVESLLLALAFFRFKTKPELVFTFITALGSTLLLIGSPEPAPVWSAGLAALVMAISGVVLQLGLNQDEQRFAWKPILSSAVFYLASVTALASWCWRLEPSLRFPVTVGVATVLSAVALFLNRKIRMVAMQYSVLLFLAAALLIVSISGLGISTYVAFPLMLAGCWLWHRFGEKSIDSILQASAFAGVTAISSWNFIHQLNLSTELIVLTVAGAGLILLLIGKALRCPTLAISAVFLPLAALIETGYHDPLAPFVPFMITAIALAEIGVMLVRKSESLVAIPPARITAFLGFVYGCYLFSPEYHADLLAGTALALILISTIIKRPIVTEAAGFAAIGWLGVVAALIMGPWQVALETAWSGAAVIAASLAIAITWRRGSHLLGIWVAALTSLWSTQMLVMRLDWNGTAVLWAMLGFAFVSIGLWRRLLGFRQVGFVLLAASLIKVFAVDVWDFNAFMRVASFSVLGLALILLGLFYNRFAPLLKRLLEEEMEHRP